VPVRAVEAVKRCRHWPSTPPSTASHRFAPGCDRHG
jgi:hypothetical protein